MSKTKTIKIKKEDLEEKQKVDVNINPEAMLSPEEIDEGIFGDKEVDPYHDAPGSVMEKPSKIEDEMNTLKSSLNEILGLVNRLGDRLQPVLAQREVQGTNPRELYRLPEMVADLVEMNNVATEVKEKLKDLDVNIVL